MICSKCNAENENDSRFCSECGTPVEEPSPAQPARRPRQYLYALLLIPVVLVAAAIGYYKFFLPEGIAAVVNGEEIRLSELDAAVLRTAGGGAAAADGRVRYQILSTLINERLVLQEAQRIGMALSREEVKTAVGQARSASGLDDRSFEERVASEYGSMRDFERAVERSVLINKYVAEKVVPADSDARTARAAVDRWLQDRTAAASVRVTLAEQWSGAGCGCCNNKPGTAAAQAGNGAVQTARSNVTAPAAEGGRKPEITRAGMAAEAARRYWSEKYGVKDFTTEVTDFGCHMQVDIMKDNKRVGSLRYQGGSVSEL